MKNVVHNIDCMIGMAEKPDLYYDLAICDVPYGINVANMAFLKEKKTTVKQKNGSKLNANKQKITYASKNWDLQTPSQSYFDELVRISKNQIIFGVEYVCWKGLGSGRIKWDKGIPEEVSFKSYEMAYCSLIDNEITISLLWHGMNQAKSLSEPMTQKGNKKLNEKRIHPCHKPILLYYKLIKEFGFEGCKILDTHVGSASSRIAAYDMGCYYEGYEIDYDYWEKQEKRYTNHVKQLRLDL